MNAECRMPNAERGALRTSPCVHRSSFIVHRFRRSAFTLLEVLLTLAIAGVLIAAIASALNVHLRVVEAGRAEVEQAQLARALLRRMADDLRGAVPPVDASSSAAADAAADLASTASSAGTPSGTGVSSAGSSGGVTNIGGTSASGVTDLSKSSGGAAAGGSSSIASSAAASTGAATGAATDSADDDAASPVGLYGTQYDLTLDVSRLPRPDQSAATADPSTSTAVATLAAPGDVRTVAYYVSSVAAGPDGTAGGLVRRQLDRAAAAYSAALGAADRSQYEQLLAPEVAALSLRYYDGTDWLTEWDSSARAALPVCVEISVTLRTAGADASSDPLQLFSSAAAPAEKTYRLLVHLPAAEPSTAADAATTSSASESAATP